MSNIISNEYVDSYKGISVGDYVSTQWKGYHKVVKIKEIVTKGWKGRPYTNIHYYVQYVCSDDGIPTKSKTKVRKAYSVSKVTPERIEAGRVAAEKKYKRLSEFFFPDEESKEPEENEDSFFAPLGGLLREE
jgi:hypothetical protein